MGLPRVNPLRFSPRLFRRDTPLASAGGVFDSRLVRASASHLGVVPITSSPEDIGPMGKREHVPTATRFIQRQGMAEFILALLAGLLVAVVVVRAC